MIQSKYRAENNVPKLSILLCFCNANSRLRHTWQGKWSFIHPQVAEADRFSKVGLCLQQPTSIYIM